MGYLMVALSRHCEFQADEFAGRAAPLGLNKASELADALRKLSVDNLGFPLFDRLYSALYHTHPTVIERIERLRKFE